MTKEEIVKMNNKFPAEVLAACIVEKSFLTYQEIAGRPRTVKSIRMLGRLEETFLALFQDDKIPHVKSGRG